MTATAVALELTPIEKAAAETDLHFLACREPLGQCEDCMRKVRELRRQLAAIVPAIEEAARGRQLLELAEAGRLLPEGCSLQSGFQVSWYDDAGPSPIVWWGCDSLEHARQAAQDPPDAAVRGEIQAREHWTSRWSVVERVEVQAPEAAG